MEFLYRQLNDNVLSENDLFYLKNPNIKLPIHKVIGFKSLYIKKIYNTNLESTNEIKFENCDDKLLKMIQRYFYFNKIDIDFNNILDILEISNFLLLDDIFIDINKFLNDSKFILNNFECIYKISINYNINLDESVLKKINNYIKNNIYTYGTSCYITELNIIIENLNLFDINQVINIFHNILELDETMIESLKAIILNYIENCKFLSKENFWNNFVPLLNILNIDIDKIPNINKIINFINKFDGKIKNINDYNKYLQIINYEKNDLVDVKDTKDKWYLGKILEKIKINDNIYYKIIFRGWDIKFIESININENINKIDIPYAKSIDFRKCKINDFVEYKIDNSWKLFTIIKISDDYIGLQEYRKSNIIKCTFDNFNLISYGTHIKSTFYKYNIEVYDIDWDNMPFDTYIQES